MFRECLCYLLAALIFFKLLEIVLPCHINSPCIVSFNATSQIQEEAWLGEHRTFEGASFGRFSGHRRQRRQRLSALPDVSLSPVAFSLSGETPLSSQVALTSSTIEDSASSRSYTNVVTTASTSLPGQVISGSAAITAGSIQSTFTSLETSTSISSLSDSSFSASPLTPFASSSSPTSFAFTSPSEIYTSSLLPTSTDSTSSSPSTTISDSSSESVTLVSTSVEGSSTTSSGATTSTMSDTTSAISESSSVSITSSATSTSLESTSFSTSSISSSVGVFPTSLTPTSPVSTSFSSVILPSISLSSSVSSRSRETSSRASSTSVVLSSSTISPVSSTTFSRPLTTIFTTSFVMTTIFTHHTSHHTTTTAVGGTGVLGTDVPGDSSFARNTGAIVGVAVSAALVLVALVLVIFFGCKRYKAQRSEHGSLENILSIARETSWRAPLDGDESEFDSVHEDLGQSASLPHFGVSSQSHSSNGTEGGVHSGDRVSSGGGGYGSAETANAEMPVPLTPSFGGQPYLPGLVHVRQQDGAPEMMQIRWDSNDSQAAQTTNQHSAGDRSAVSLTVAGGSSSNEHGAGWSSSSSGDHHARSLDHKRGSLSEPRPMPPGQLKDRRHNSTPPSAFPTTTSHTFDIERQQEQSDKNNIKGLFNRLRRGRKNSSHSTASTSRDGGVDQARVRGSDETTPAVPDLPLLFSPSLLNPPMFVPPPSQALLYSPRGATGKGYTELPPLRREVSGTLTAMWPPLTLPPSPDPTEHSNIVEGLLHPRLGKRSSGHEEASITSLRDHEDYSRPISGLISNHIRSTTTFDTTLGSDDVGIAT